LVTENEYKTLSDIALFILLKKDDHAAFTEIHHRYWERLMAIALQRVKDVHIAQDIMQEVFVSLWNNRQKAVIEKPENYLATAVKYLSITHLRTGKKMYLLHETLTNNLTDDVAADQLLYAGNQFTSACAATGVQVQPARRIYHSGNCRKTKPLTPYGKKSPHQSTGTFSQNTEIDTYTI
jgi:hypothetical protein